MKFDKISVIGLGYIGLPTAAIFASRKIKVVGVDVNPHAVETINRGEVHIVEPELDIAVRSAVQSGYLRASLKTEPANAFLIAVPTPFKEGKVPDLSYIKAACESIAPVLRPGNLVILESTSPVGATEQMAKWLGNARPDLSFPEGDMGEPDIHVAHCPERVLPGQVLRELVQNDRVIGGLTTTCSEHAASLYKLIIEGQCIITDARTAEMCKLTENSFRDVNIAFANELSMICDHMNINVWDLIKLANLHPRVNILQPGPGVGGHCIAVDPWFIVSSSPDQAKLIRRAREVNDLKPQWVLKKVDDAIEQLRLKKPRPVVACFGLAFKPNIDDLRESPALNITVEICKREIVDVIVVEPNIDELPTELQQRAQLVEHSHAIQHADLLVLLVDHKQFRDHPAPSHPKIIDTRGIW
ncbi:UDP-N-acetyl-D-mannosamine dehydrogenase [Pseudomonas sp. KNUC1026]|uniref:UDP-N-acetyl-D-mannosamine dehydrogenase n=1 Tax=Pseudomonas sp. KNUC1026 TaxID=2893890 RepID=UPI001F3E074A|nr:UDP-N-acetyl-D-mannosamine dehydrogenase [Pseudomonas sp. KNUC1026]UFH48235.1 UDP-N-acetyl-D-mannosamine dehydrogenase [Pseudomonas sp. KNUC1026]